MHHYVIVNPRKIGFNGAVSPPTAALVIYLSLFPTFPISLLHPVNHQSFSNYTLSIHKSIIIISMVTGFILHWLWPIVQCNCTPKSSFQRKWENTQRHKDLDVVMLTDCLHGVCEEFRENIVFKFKSHKPSEDILLVISGVFVFFFLPLHGLERIEKIR